MIDSKSEKIHEKCGVMVVEYKSGKRRAIDLAPHVVKNGYCIAVVKPL